MSSRSAIIFVILATAIFFVHSQSHNVTWGMRGPNDIHLHKVVVFKKSSFLRRVEDDYEFNLKTTPYVREITQVVVTDQYTNGNGGFATLASGGPKTTHVKIHFRSQRNHGFNFIVDIYGH